MDTLIGLLLGIGLILSAAMFGGPETFTPFWSFSALLIVVGGSIAALMVAFPFRSILQSAFFVRKCFVNNKSEVKAMIEQIISFAESARREGLLALENRLDQIEDKFLAEGLRLAVDGLNPATVETILNSEMEAMQYRHQQGRNIVVHAAKYAPAFGMIGTLIGLVLMLTQLDAETVGTGMAVAVLTTLYGSLAANLFLLPISEKLKQMHEAEMRIKYMIVRCVLAIQAGEHPRIIQLKLLTFLPPSERPNDPILASESETVTLPINNETEERKLAA